MPVIDGETYVSYGTEVDAHGIPRRSASPRTQAKDDMMTLRSLASFIGSIAAWIVTWGWIGLASPAHAQDCNALQHPWCYNVQLRSCPTNQRVCGTEYPPNMGSFTCGCLSACSKSDDCQMGETCWLQRCVKGEACNADWECRTSGDRCVDGNCGRGEPLPPPECTTDDHCRPTNACGGIRHCSVSTGRCVVDLPAVACPPPSPKFVWVDSPKIGYPVIVEQRTRCEPVAGSSTETRCVTTPDEPQPRLCPPPSIDAPGRFDNRPSLEVGPRRQAEQRFRATTLVAGTPEDIVASPNRIAIRIADRDSVELIAASTLPGDSTAKAGWVRDKATRTWQWTNHDRLSSPLDRVVLRDAGRGRFAVEVHGRLKPNPAPMHHGTDGVAKGGYQTQVEVAWGTQALTKPGALLVDKTQACTVWVGDCRRAANGGYQCRVRS